MKGGHVAEDLWRVKVEALRNEGFGGLAKLAFLSQSSGATDVVAVVVVVVVVGEVYWERVVYI